MMAAWTLGDGLPKSDHHDGGKQSQVMERARTDDLLQVTDSSAPEATPTPGLPVT